MKVLFFGILKDIAGRAEDQLDLENSATVGGVFDHYCSQFPRLREMAGSILLARNQEFADVYKRQEKDIGGQLNSLSTANTRSKTC